MSSLKKSPNKLLFSVHAKTTENNQRKVQLLPFAEDFKLDFLIVDSKLKIFFNKESSRTLPALLSPE